MLFHQSRATRSGVRAALVPAISLAVGAALTATSALPSAATSQQRAAAQFRPAHAAAGWQGTQLDKSGAIPSPFGGGFKDWGLTVDTGFALAADGQHPGKLSAVTTALRDHWFADYVTFRAAAGQPRAISANAAAKTLVAAKVLGRNARNFGGRDVRKMVLARVGGTGVGEELGRLTDRTTVGSPDDFSNTFGQAFGVIGLARSGGVPTEVVDYLIDQRCSAGYFSIVESPNQTCDEAGSPADVDATALAVQALIAARDSGVTLPDGVLGGTLAWLVSVQKTNGSFGGGVGTEASNSNSTGLAAQALKAAHRNTPAEAAKLWVSRIQITPGKAGNGPAKKDIGAIAYNREGFRDAIENGLTDTSRGQFQRATPQAYFAIDPQPLGVLTAP
jgi:hypothetical protein